MVNTQGTSGAKLSTPPTGQAGSCLGLGDNGVRLVTGVAGFIGFSLAQRLLADGLRVVGIDNLNAYYDPRLKHARLKELKTSAQFQFVEVDLVNAAAIKNLFAEVQPGVVYHLAAQAGVRYSLDQPFAYTDSNVTGFLSVLEAARHVGVAHLVFASSSSVYGNRHEVPFRVSDRTDEPVSLYAATKKANELMAYTYSHLYQLPVTGLRFFTVYGPWGRPDMAYFSFTQKILKGEPIHLFNNGHHQRDFTYIDDIVEGVCRVGETPMQHLYRIFNIGNSHPVGLNDFIATLEDVIGKKAVLVPAAMAPGDVLNTYADTTELEALYGYRPTTSLREGLIQFWAWCQSPYGRPHFS